MNINSTYIVIYYYIVILCVIDVSILKKIHNIY